VIQFSGTKSFRRVNGQVYPFDDHGYGLGGFVERSVRGSALSWELLDILHHLVLPTADMCPYLTNCMHRSVSLEGAVGTPSLPPPSVKHSISLSFFMKDRRNTIS